MTALTDEEVDEIRRQLREKEQRARKETKPVAPPRVQVVREGDWG